jgi:hypothetical protein
MNSISSNEFFSAAADNLAIITQLEQCSTSEQVTQVAYNFGYSLKYSPRINRVREFVDTLNELNDAEIMQMSDYELHSIQMGHTSPATCSGGCQSVAHGMSAPSSCCE